MMTYLMILFVLIPLSFRKSLYWIFDDLYLLMMGFFIIDFKWGFIYNKICLFYGVDLLSYWMIILSFFISSLMILASFNLTKVFTAYFLFLILVNQIFTFMSFVTMDFVLFYFFFEASLIPTLIMILGWGGHPERLQAGYYMFMYTMVASLPMLISLVYYYYFMGHSSLNLLKSFDSWLYFVFMNMVFLVKIPMYILHLWLPKAHVEAPVFGSMLLAGVLLKLGAYGLIRASVMFINEFMTMNYLLISISLLGGVMVSLICMRQNDMKSLVAYSSVIHMGLLLSGVVSMTFFGFMGSLIMMISHGLCSSGLFCLINIFYERFFSRSLFINKGMINLFPSLSLWWFLFSVINMSAPPSLNLLSEIIIITSLVNLNYILLMLLMVILFFSAAYSLFLYSSSQHGKLNISNFNLTSVNIREYLLMFMHWFPLNLVFIGDSMIWL
uniref:NADH-ubiquinone oxidoreductase chain 4 n=1 Tax=Scydmaeninae sp. 840218 TaxID=1213605 RepID=A0A0S2MP71_9COLE|nr:NADH deshydrogenase subunit 4 [Scydmaeninae sp. 840218]